MAMQKRLIAKGAKIKADGIMGAKTRAAMKKFMSKPTVPAKKKVMVDSFKKSNVSANKNKKAGIDAAKGDNKKAKTFKSSNPKLDSKGNYKGTNIKPTKLQLERMKKRRARASSTQAMGHPTEKRPRGRNLPNGTTVKSMTIIKVSQTK